MYILECVDLLLQYNIYQFIMLYLCMCESIFLGPSPTISATSVTTTSVVISIENLPQLKYIVRFSINWYKVQYNLADGTGVTMFNIVQPRDSITVDNLVPGKTYVFKVAYVARRNNIPANSTGPFSNSITITTIISGMYFFNPHS